jgi:carboxypeptidase Q
MSTVVKRSQLQEAKKRAPHTHTGGTGCYKDRVEQ